MTHLGAVWGCSASSVPALLLLAPPGTSQQPVVHRDKPASRAEKPEKLGKKSKRAEARGRCRLGGRCPAEGTRSPALSRVENPISPSEGSEPPAPKQIANGKDAGEVLITRRNTRGMLL